jgi:hypothetical protein
MTLGNTIWLWGMLGLLMPLTIHLLSRKEGKTIYIGSVRHLLDSNTARFSSLRLNEILLLIIRSVLISLIVLLLASLYTDWFTGQKRNWVLIEKGVEQNSATKNLIDSLDHEGYEVRLLSSGFPLLKDSAVVRDNNYWNLIQSLQQEQLNDVVVFSFSQARSFKGQRVSLPENIQWITVDQSSKSFLQSALEIPGGYLKIRKGETDAYSTNFETEISPSKSTNASTYQHDGDEVGIDSLQPIAVHIYSSINFEHDVKVLHASLQAIEKELSIPITITTDLTTSNKDTASNIIIWLSTELIPAEMDVLMAVGNCKDYLPVLLPGFQSTFYCSSTPKSKWILTKRLNEENVLNENFTVQLAKIISSELKLFSNPKEDQRVMPASMSWSKDENGPKISNQLKSAAPFLAVLILITLLTERWIAFKRNQ